MVVRSVPFRFPGVERVHCLFQLRSDSAPFSLSGNISLEIPLDTDAAVAETVAARQALADCCGVAGMVDVHQVHGDTVVFDPLPVAPGRLPAIDADGMATDRVNLALMIKTADCQPLLLTETSGRYVAALHVGWKGNRIGFPQTGVRNFCEHYGVRPQDVLVVRGPSLGPAAAEFTGFAQEWGDDFLPWFDETRRIMNLWRLTWDQLHEVGVLPEHMFGLDLCTWSLPELFSFRRDRRCGRQGSVIWIEPGPVRPA